MKKFRRAGALLAALAVIISLAACGTKEVIEDQADKPDESQQNNVVIPEINDDEIEEEPEVVYYRNPLTGEITDTDISSNRPYMVMLNTIDSAMPQYGNSQADIYYEMLEEGGITRILGVYQTLEGVGKVGSIRSTRQYYVQLAYALDSFLIHCGASPYGFDEISRLGIDNINEITSPSGLFYRDSDRRNAGYAYEHTLFFNSDDIVNWVENSSGYETEHSESWMAEHSHTFVEDGTPDGEAANTVTVPFSGYKTNVFTYDAATGKYAVNMYGEPYIDAVTGETIEVTNVIVIKTPVSVISDAGHVDMDLIGPGDGYYINGGKYIPITWSKGDLSDLFSFKDADGNEISLGIGKTYVCFIPTTKEVTFG